ncbi:uncharacterized protein LOC124932707 [Impatiens glandulifera]|uniref:uncharacterized protein LOC124932707 n=1 Tax=Impatiens glandulifera TaxID=253017 RepID=UPI001FB13EAB|nr:uncharacterized protein LOC124932707 [Impatiens glandulifera]
MGFSSQPEFNHRNPIAATATTALGFTLLPSELIQQIILNLSLPDITRLKPINKLINSITHETNFLKEYNARSSASTWLFLYRKPWHRNSILHGFSDDSNRWFKFRIDHLLHSKFDDAYFLVAGGNIFLFALNSSRDVISVNPISGTTKRLPPSPLGPRDTSRWRRSGMKLLPGPPGSGHFKFLFTDLIHDHPFLFIYDSISDEWKSKEAREGVREGKGGVVLSVVHRGNENIKIAYNNGEAVILRPRLDVGVDGLRVYGDGKMMIVGSEGGSVKMIKCVELYGLSLINDERKWEKISSKMPNELIEKIKRPYNVIMGCLEETKNGKMVRAVLVSNYEGQMDITWLCYDMDKMTWTWVPLPDCQMKGSNMAGIAFSSSGLTLPSN